MADTTSDAAAPDGVGSGGSAGRGRRPGGGLFGAARELVIVVGTALVLSLVVKTFLFQAFWIPSSSMEDTLMIGDRVVVSKLTPGPFDLERGDIVVFQDPGNWLPPVPEVDRGPVGDAVHSGLEFVGLAPTEDNEHLIKRVVGLPGDHVVCCGENGNLEINGTAVAEPYVHDGNGAGSEAFDIVVPEGRVWMMGDNRSNSGDSRFHDNGSGGADGSVPQDLIVGRAAVLVWPTDRWNWFGGRDSVYADVPEPTS